MRVSIVAASKYYCRDSAFNAVARGKCLHGTHQNSLAASVDVAESLLCLTLPPPQ